MRGWFSRQVLIQMSDFREKHCAFQRDAIRRALAVMVGKRRRTNLVDWAASVCATASAVLAAPSRREDPSQMGAVERFLYGQQTLVHTFDTPDSCARKCPRPCSVQEVQDLMMPRWICPSKPDDSVRMHLTPSFRDSRELGQDLFPFSSQFLLILVPVATLLAIALLIVWCRRYSNNTLD